MKQRFVPEVGRLAVVREASEALQRLRAAELAAADETVQDQGNASQWALVVGVGGPRVSDSGREITTDVRPGEMVLVSEVGRFVKLKASDGTFDFIYVMPFEGVMGRLEWECEACNATREEKVYYRIEPEGGICPTCPLVLRPTGITL